MAPRRKYASQDEIDDLTKEVKRLQKRMYNMALDFSKQQATVTKLNNDVQTLIQAYVSGSPATEAANQKLIDDITNQLSMTDNAVTGVLPNPAEKAPQEEQQEQQEQQEHQQSEEESPRENGDQNEASS